MPYYPQTFAVASTDPANGATDVPTTAVLRIRFVAPMDPLSVSTSTLRVFAPDKSAVAGTVAYDPAADPLAATFRPAGGRWLPSTLYLVEVLGGPSGVRTTAGSTFPLSFTFQFTTAAEPEQRPQAPVLLTPEHQSQIGSLTSVAFTWQGVTGAATYEIQVGTFADFSVVGWQTTTPNTSVTASSEPFFTSQSTSVRFFWRVRARNSANLEGPWSEVFQFVYAPYEELVPRAPALLTLVRSDPPHEAAFVPTTSLRWVLEFSAALDAATLAGAVQVQELPLVGSEAFRTQGAVALSPSISASGSRLELDLANTPPKPNTEYIVLVQPSLRGTGGEILADPVQIRFVTEVSPCYSSISQVRSELGDLAVSVPDVDLAKILLTVSLRADRVSALPYGTVLSSEGYGDLPGGAAPRYRDPYQRTNAVWFEEYVRFETAVRVLQRVIGSRVVRYGARTQVGDVVVQAAGSMVPDVSVLITRLEQRRDDALQRLMQGPATLVTPASVYRGEVSRPYNLAPRVSY